MQELGVLVLGAGWTSTFLIPLLQQRKIKFDATTRDGRKVAGVDTIQWTFNPDESTEDSGNQFSKLPLARSVLITFPLNGKGQSPTLVNGYLKAHNKKQSSITFIQLGSTGIWQIPQSSVWVNRKSPYDSNNKRAIAEDELLELGGSVLNLAGLWGGQRDPRDWVDRVAKTKDDVKGKKSLHLVHGLDVARAIVAVAESGDATTGQRWMLTDGFVYDWWALFAAWADSKNNDEVVTRDPSNQSTWVFELMGEEQVLALPRSMESLGRCYDSRDFWYETYPICVLRYADQDW